MQQQNLRESLLKLMILESHKNLLGYRLSHKLKGLLRNHTHLFRLRCIITLKNSIKWL